MLLQVIVLAAIGGGVPTFQKIALQTFPTLTFILIRFIVAFTVLAPIFIKHREKLHKNDIVPIILISLLGTGNVLFVAFGVKRTTAISTQVLYAGVPVIAMFASFLILKTQTTRRQIVGILIGLIGVLIIVISPKINNGIDNAGSLVGNLLVFTAVVSYSLYTVFSKKLQQFYSPLFLTTMMIIVTIFIQVFLAPTEIGQYKSTLKSITAVSIISLLYVSIFGTAIYFLLYQKIIKTANPVVASMTLYLQPISSILWASFILNEKLTLGILIGGILGLLGASLVVKKKEKVYSHRTHEPA
jgi:drug/metabolite transporter (DMT)-like permease